MNTMTIDRRATEADARLGDYLHKLRKLRMSCMANAFVEQISDPANTALPFEERFLAVVDAEYSLRLSNRRVDVLPFEANGHSDVFQMPYRLKKVDSVPREA